MMEALDFPKANLKLKRANGEIYVWCIIRKKNLICTPEEWVRQHAIHYLIEVIKIPIGLIASEYSLNYNGINKRADVVAFDREKNPVLIVECKSTNIEISEETLFQIAQYNFSLNVDYLFLTNGLKHLICKLNKSNQEFELLKALPAFII